MNQENTTETSTSEKAVQELNGSCFVVVMPLGQQDDITGRGVWGIQSADILIATDEKEAATLLKRYAVSISILGLTMESLDAATEAAFEALRNRKRVTILTDPVFGVTEPVHALLSRIREAGKEPRILPGVDLAATALAMSGFPTERYFVAGHMPMLWGHRSEFVRSLVDCRETTIFFAPGPRVNSAMSALEAEMPNREIVVVLKPTIPGESIIRGTIQEILDRRVLRRPQGTATFVLAPAVPTSTSTQVQAEHSANDTTPSEVEAGAEPDKSSAEELSQEVQPQEMQSASSSGNETPHADNERMPENNMLTEQPDEPANDAKLPQASNETDTQQPKN